MSHPYKPLENTPLWQIIDNALKDLVENQDLKLLTSKVHIVGYLCKKINNATKSQPINPKTGKPASKIEDYHVPLPAQ